MTIAYVSGSSVANAHSGSASNPVSLSIPAPAGIVAGNLLLASVYLAANTGSTAETIGVPTGWTIVGTSANPSSAGLHFTAWKITTASEPGSYAFSFTNVAVLSDLAGAILQYSGVNTSSPIQTSAFDQNTQFLLYAAAPGFTTTGPATWVASWCSFQGNTFTNPSGFTSRQAPSSAGNVTLLVSDQAVPSAQTTVQAAATMSSNDFWAASSIALNPATGSSSGSATVALAGSGTLASSAKLQASRSAAITGSGALTVSVTESAGSSVAISGSGSLTAGKSLTGSASVSLSGSGAMGAIGGTGGANQAALSGVGSLSLGPVTEKLNAGVSLSGAGALTVGSTSALTRTTALTGSGALSVTVGSGATPAAVFHGAGDPASSVNGGTSVDVPWPVNSVGDFVLLTVASTSTVSTPAGWTLLASDVTNANAHLYVFWQYLTAVQTNAITVTCGAGITRGVITSYSNGTSTAPTAYAIGHSSGAGAGVVTPAVAFTDFAILAIGTAPAPLVNSAAGGNWTPTIEVNSNQGGSPSLMVIDGPISAGTTETLSATLSGAAAWSAFAISPDATGGSGGSTQVGTAVLTGSGSLGIAANIASAAQSNFSGSGSLSVSSPPRIVQSVALSGSGSLNSSTPGGVSSANVTLTGSGQLAAALGSLRLNPGVALSGSGTLSDLVTGSVTAAPVALSGSGTLGETQTQTSPDGYGVSGYGANYGDPYGATVYFFGDGGLLVTAGIGASATVALAGVGSLSAIASETLVANAPLTGSGSLGIVATPIFGALLSGAGTLGVLSSATPATNASLSGLGTLQLVGQPVEVSSVALSGVGGLSTVQTVHTDFSGTGALSTVPQVTEAGIANLAGSGGLVVISQGTPTSALALSGSGALSTSGGVPTLAVGISLTGSGTLSRTVSLSDTGNTSDLSGSGTLLSTPSAVQTVTPLALSGDGILGTAAGSTGISPVALSGSGALSLDPSTILPATAGLANLTGSGDLSALGTRLLGPSSVSLTGSGVLDAGIGSSIIGTAQLAGDGALSVPFAVALFGAQTLSGQGALSTVQALATLASPALSGSGTLSAAAASQGTSTPVNLSGTGALSSPGRVGELGAATFSGSGDLTEIDSSTATPVAPMSGSGALSTLQTGTSSSPSLSGIGSLSTISGLTLAVRPVAFSGLGTLSGAGTRAIATTASFSGSGTLSSIDFAWQSHGFGILVMYGNPLRVRGWTQDGGIIMRHDSQSVSGSIRGQAIDSHGNPLRVSVGYKTLSLV